jgi:hypothetical protein
LKPSAKSWLSTAIDTTAPAVLPAWKPAPMAKPSITLWPTRAAPANRPTPGRAGGRRTRPHGAVDGHRTLTNVQGQEADDSGEQGQLNAEQLAGFLAERLRHQVEGDDTEHEPGGEPEDEVLVVAEPQGREPTDQGGDE